MPNSKTKQSKAGFIRAQSWDLPAAEVVKMAKAIGIKITVQTVHSTRSAARKQGGGKTATRAPAPPSAKGSVASDSDQQDVQQFVKLVAAIGLRRAEQLLSQVSSKFAAL